jgi:thymidylate synthase (FAD)
VKARLISYSQPVRHVHSGDLGIMGLDNIQDLIAYCARVSNPTNQSNTKTSEKLLQYLAKHKHWSPFEMASATMEIETTRDIARQMLRHRSFAFQEFSQRYADPALMGDQFVLREARLQDTKNRQNSVETNDRILQRDWEIKQQMVINASKEAYEWAIENGIAKEQARSVLPEGNTISRLYMSGTIRSWIHFIELRSANGTQKEHMEIARETGAAIASIFPLVNTYVNKEL